MLPSFYTQKIGTLILSKILILKKILAKNDCEKYYIFNSTVSLNKDIKKENRLLNYRKSGNFVFYQDAVIFHP